MDAGTTLAKFRTTYVANEHNIDRQYLDHRSVSTYNQFGYDNLDRLTGVTYFDDPVDAFTMDDLGNRIGNQTQRDILHNYYMDPLTNDPKTNRYSTIDAAPITHDDAGNLTRDRQDYRYEYDYENRIARIYKLSGQSQVTVASFDYDALGHRVRKIDTIAGRTTLYYNDPEWRVLAEYDGSGTLQRTYVWGNYIDEALRMRMGESDYYYLHDHLYSPAGLVNSSGTVVERYEYDAYGTARVMDPSFGTRATTQYGVTTLFTGRTLDALDSNALKISYYRHRYTDPFTGRFLQQDPMEYIDGLNLYEYVRSNPEIGYDPKGTDFIAIASRPLTPRPFRMVAGHYSLQRWYCCNKFSPLAYGPGFSEHQIIKKCGGPGYAKKVDWFELIPTTDCHVWGYNSGIVEQGWQIFNPWISEIRYKGQEPHNDKEHGKDIIPVVSSSSTNIIIRFENMKTLARQYPYAEQYNVHESRQFPNWPRSLYKMMWTNSNTFIRWVAGPLMTEMVGRAHPGNQTPSQNYENNWTFSADYPPWTPDMPIPPKPSGRP